MSARPPRSSESGQGTVEWVALLVLVSLVLGAVAAAAGARLPGTALARAVAERLVCAAGLRGECGEESRLALAYGDELATLIGRHAPEIRYERGMRALPVDYRRCRADACADGVAEGEVWRSRAGEPATAFVHVVDCREEPSHRPEPPPDCSGAAAGNLYLHYWLYYPGSATGEGSTPLRGVIREVSTALGAPSYHPDDWESLQVRIGPRGRFARASSHHGYGPGWLPSQGALFVAGGSHAGRVLPREFARRTPGRRLRLVALAPIVERGPRARFADGILPPWRKRVWAEPEYAGTD